MENLNKIPTVLHPDGLPKPKCKSRKNRDLVDCFINGVGLQEFCNNPENKVQAGMLMQICCSQENKYYTLSSGEFIDTFRINLFPNEGLRLYKMGRFINRPSCGSEVRTFYSATFVVTFEDGYWNAELILEDDGQLSSGKVKKAFQRIAGLKELTSLGTKPQMSSIRLAIQGTAAFETKAWAQKFMTPEGEEKTFLCLMDNGRILEVSEKEMPVCEPCKDAVLRTKFNWFSWDGFMYNRLKD